MTATRSPQGHAHRRAPERAAALGVVDTITLTPDAIAMLLAGDILVAPWSLADAIAAARTGGLSAIFDDGRIVALDDAERPDRSARVWSRQLGHEVTAYRVAIMSTSTS